MYVCMIAHTLVVAIRVGCDNSVVVVNALEHIDGHVIPPANEVAVTVDSWISRSVRPLPLPLPLP